MQETGSGIFSCPLPPYLAPLPPPSSLNYSQSKHKIEITCVHFLWNFTGRSLEVPPPPVLWPLSPRQVHVFNTSINFRCKPLLVINHYPTCTSYLNRSVRTCRAMGSRLKSQESPTESSSASSIAFNCDAYSSKNWPYFLNCASPTISKDNKD